MSHQYLLFESALGYALFQRKPSEAIGELTPQVQQSFTDFAKFSTIIQLHSFLPFPSAEKALLENNSVADGELTDFLQNFIESNLPINDKHLVIGVPDDKLSNAITDALKVHCVRDSTTIELFRGIRQHFSKYLTKTSTGDLEKAQLGLAHSFSRSRVKFNINRVDNMIIQSLFLVDQLDKDINTFALRIKEWYAWHFPELKQIVEDNYQFAQAVKIIQSKSTLIESNVSADLSELFDEITVKKIIAAAKSSMGTDISDFDLLNITHFATRVINLTDYRTKLQDYLTKKMNDIAPNISALLGETIGARLISQSGSLNNLAKQPASTVQILGAEKALFR
jgi:nucleolar protein 56